MDAQNQAAECKHEQSENASALNMITRGVDIRNFKSLRLFILLVAAILIASIMIPSREIDDQPLYFKTESRIKVTFTNIDIVTKIF
jgi:hypothetical protein